MTNERTQKLDDEAQRYAEELLETGGLPPKNADEDDYVDPEPQDPNADVIERARKQPAPRVSTDEAHAAVSESRTARTIRDQDDEKWIELRAPTITDEIESRFERIENRLAQIGGLDEDYLGAEDRVTITVEPCTITVPASAFSARMAHLRRLGVKISSVWLVTNE